MDAKTIAFNIWIENSNNDFKKIHLIRILSEH